MKTRRLVHDERLGFCHDCHNRARIEITFSHRTSIRLCDRCAGFLIENVAAVCNDKNAKTKAPVGG
jgi:hypothetical protein